MSKKYNNDQWIGVVNNILDSISNIAHNAADTLGGSKEEKNLVDYDRIAENLADQKVKWWKIVLKYVFGGILFIPAIASLVAALFMTFIPQILLLSLSALLFVPSVALLSSADRDRKLKKLIKEYIPVIGMRPEASVVYLSSALMRKVRAVKREILTLLRAKVFSDMAYYDKKLDILVLDGYREQPSSEKKDTKTTIYDLDEWNNKIGICILEINNVDVRQKLNVLQDYINKIKGYVAEKPEKEKRLRTFVNYYLPTTVKLMESYITIEKIGADGYNIRETKVKIENSLDLLAKAYRNQFEALFFDEALDISGDIDVLEHMVKRDGFDK